jgi:hypothetical protein
MHILLTRMSVCVAETSRLGVPRGAPRICAGNRNAAATGLVQALSLDGLEPPWVQPAPPRFFPQEGEVTCPSISLLPLSFWRPGHHSMKLPYLYYCSVYSSQKFWTPTLLSAKYHCYHLHIVNKIPNPSNYTFIFFLLDLQVLCTWQLIWLIPDTQHELLWDYSMCADTSRGTAVRELIAWSLEGALTPAQQQVFLFPLLFLTWSQRSYTNPREDEGENPDEFWWHFMLIVPWVDIAL